MRDKIKKSSKSSFHAQRNWDRSKSIPWEDIDTLLSVIQNSPTKQAETHYKVFWTDDQDLIYKIYRKTKHFAVTPQGSFEFTDSDGKTEKDYNVRNSQVYSNVLFAFAFDWDQEEARSNIHAIVDIDQGNVNALREKDQQRCYSMGIAIGELILSANLLGYKTGICSAFWANEIEQYFDGETISVLVGVGHPSDRPRTEHEEVYNRDILAKDRRSGPDNEKWKFPAFNKKMIIKKL